MSYTVENLENSMAKLTITVSAGDFEKAMQQSYNKNKKHIGIPGFRRGKVPRKMIEKMYGPEVFYEDAADFAIPDAYEAAAKECGLDIVSRPEIDLVDMGVGKDFVFTATVAVKPEVTLGAYKGIEVEKRDVEVADSEVDDELARVCEQNSRMVTIDGSIEMDDTAVIDYEGFVDGKPFDGGRDEAFPLVIGSHSFIDNFEEQLVGRKAGDELDVNVTFPEDYHEASLKGKPALFKVAVKEVRRKEMPELDDEFASEVSEFETLDEYRASVKENLAERKAEEAKRAKETDIVEKIVDNMTVELPEKMVDEHVGQMVREFATRIQYQGLSMEQYLQMTGMTLDAMESQLRPDAEKRIKTRLALEAVVKEEGITATDEDIKKEKENMASMYGVGIDQVEKMVGDAEMEQLSMDAAVQKAIDFLVGAAVEV